MVLQSTRRQDSENTPPSARSLQASGKPNLRNNIQAAASRRRRARVNGGASHPRYAIEDAKRRRAATKAPIVKLDIASALRPTTSTSLNDAEMKEATSTSPITSVSLPRYLSRPEYREVSLDKLAAVDSEMTGVPLDYVQDGLEAIGPDMMRVLSNVKTQPIRNNLPKELSIIVNDLSSQMPTHMLAVYARQSTVARRRVTLFPIHNIILAAYCANLPQLPTSNIPHPETPGSSILVPVVPLCIPAPETFPHLSAFLYTKRVDHLLASLLPCPVPLSVYDDESVESGHPALIQFATKLSTTYSPPVLLKHAMLVNGLWRNVCALGIFDERLWHGMDVAWEVLLTAMAISVGQPQMMQ